MSYKPFSITSAILTLVLFLGACTEDGIILIAGSEISNVPILSSAIELPADETCPEGGIQIDKGFDANEDGLLSEDEVNSSEVVCYQANSQLAQSTEGILLEGKDNSILSLSNPHKDPLSLMKTDNGDCNILDIVSCSNPEIFDFEHSLYKNIETINTSISSYLWLQRNNDVSESILTEQITLPLKRFAQVVEFKGALWSIGGELKIGRTTDDAIWRSYDGYRWSKVVEHAPFGSKEEHHVVVYNDKMWLTGGNPGFSNEVWVSDNGIDWTQVEQVTPYQGRSHHQVVAFNGKMWMLGGKNGSAFLNDVLTSTDGANWQVETTTNVFSPRYWHQAIVFKNKLWVFNGQSQSGTSKRNTEIYSSSDGLNWTKETSSPTYGGIIGHQILTFDDKLWLISGYTNGYRKQVYSSEDAVNWTRETNNAFTALAYHQAVAFKRNLFVFSGGGYSYEHWVSKNGIDWQTLDHYHRFSNRKSHQAIEFKNALWMLGGRNHNNQLTGGVLTSNNGLNWQTIVSSDQLPFTARDEHQLVSFNDALWVIGGREVDGYKNDVWHSSNGIDWVEVNQVAGFSARSGHQVVVKNNRLWIIGGSTDAGLVNDVWSSADGATWQQESTGAAFPVRKNHAVQVFNDTFYLVGGIGGSNLVMNDVYQSTDGINWSLLTTHADLERHGHTLTVFDGQLLLTGGYFSGNTSADTLTSTDGITWIKEPDAISQGGVSEHQTIHFKDRLLVLGGESSVVGFDFEDNQIFVSWDSLSWYQAKHLSFDFNNGFLPEKPLQAAIKSLPGLMKTNYKIALDGSLSDATNYEALSFNWRIAEKPAGSTATIDYATRVNTSFTPDTDGQYLIELSLSDGANTHTDQLLINTQTEPTAIITGCDSVVSSGETVVMDGSNSFDPYGGDLTYSWTVSAPFGGNTNLSDPSASSVSKKLTEDGNYNFKLTVNNGSLSNSTSKQCKADSLPI
jgi:hypothetical protein